jgi:hypothetical protein
MLNFRQALFKFAKPRLQTRGFEYDDDLRDRNITYGFRKHLGANIQAIVLFQRSQSQERAKGFAFTVNLVRSKTNDIKQWEHGTYEGYLQERLGVLLRTVYGIHSYLEVDHWWIPSTPEKYAAEISDVLDKLEEYGIPWLENPHSKPIFALAPEESNQRKDGIRSALQEVISGELGAYGYRLQEHANGSLFFGKSLWKQTNVFLLFEFRRTRNDYSPQVEFDVILIRKRSDDPFSSGQTFSGEELRTSLGQLLWYEYGVYPNKFMGWDDGYQEQQDGTMILIQKPPQKAFSWRFASDAELRQQLKDIMSKLHEYGLPWLEKPDAKNPWYTIAK